MIKNQYYPLKKENNARLNNDIDVTFRVLQNQRNAIFQLLSWEPESISENQFLLFNEACFITGYLILRIIEAVPNSQGLFKPFSNAKPPSQKKRTMMDELIYYLNAEFELYTSLQFASGGFFDIAKERKAGSDRLWIIPKTDSKAINNTLLLRMSNANEQWHGTFTKFIGDTVSWILDQPFLITKDDSYSFYVGTQIATVGTTRVCDSCKSVIKYYWGEPESETAKHVGALLKTNKCGICGNQYMSQDDSNFLRTKMTQTIGKFKHEQGLDFG